ncbi:carbamoyltransferase HypF [bacterium]|nr:carbamoyltransferase HypF [bacterium]
MPEPQRAAARFTVRGVVQGVGFRPFVYRVAHELGLSGWVVNSSRGVIVECEGTTDELRAFERALVKDAPSLSRIDAVERDELEFQGFSGFEIRSSEGDEREVTLICPDVAVCPDCLREFLDSADRRHHYPFINCTNCGPRFSIIEDTPYDRPKTSMKRFPMCPDCRREYEDPFDRRFHAQPNACSVCGPKLELVTPRDLATETAEVLLGRSYVRMSAEVVGADEAARTRWLLKQGAIVGVRGLGGFHIAASAESGATVRALREKKNRPAKPFAIMCRSLEVARGLVSIDPIEEKALTSPWSPIVLLRRRMDATRALSAHVAPNNGYLGVMLPYAPLHHLLFDDELDVIVMTSANVPGEPIIADLGTALERLGGITRTHLTHDRDIVNRNDDSIVYVEVGRPLMSRRSRGYAPYPIDLRESEVTPAGRSGPTKTILACGTELKNTFTLLDGRRAYVSQHIGDMENQATLDFYEEMLEKFLHWFRLTPDVVAHDLHPDYLATRFARRYADERDLPLVGVQHHHAHIASVMAENDVVGPVIGMALDGTGYGTDDAIWGCEFMVADLADFERAGHLKYVPLPGGDAAVRHPYRVALSHLHAAGENDPAAWGRRIFPLVDESEVSLVAQQIEKRVNCIDTSSAGRLFDAVSALLGVCTEISYEAQAAIELESLIDRSTAHVVGGPHYPFSLDPGQGNGGRKRGFIIDAGPAVLGVLADVASGAPRAVIAEAFHNTVARFSHAAARWISKVSGLKTVALSGGVFQNRYLLASLVELLERDGYRVLLNREVPTNDGSVSLGQAVVGGERARRGLE